MTSKSLQMNPHARPGFVWSHIESQILTKIRQAPPDTDLTGQVCIITGGSSGLGLECARHLLSLKLARLILAVRSPSKGQGVAQKLSAEFPSATVDVWELEMTSYESIQNFCKRVGKELSRLDITILNSGVNVPKFGLCPTGHETTIQVNYLSTFLLCILLLPLCKAKAPAGKPGRMTIVSSGTAFFAKVPNRDRRPFLASFDNTNLTPWSPAERYFSSKLLGHLFFVRLLDYLHPDDVIVNLVEPGLCKGSGLNRDLTGIAGAVMNAWKSLIGRRPQDGAWMYVHAAVVEGKESHGCFLEDWEIHAFAILAHTEEGRSLRDALWEETMNEFDFAGARQILEEYRRS